MAYLETLTSHNTQLQGLIDKANALPDAGSGGGSASVETCTVTIDLSATAAGEIRGYAFAAYENGEFCAKSDFDGVVKVLTITDVICGTEFIVKINNPISVTNYEIVGENVSNLLLENAKLSITGKAPSVANTTGRISFVSTGNSGEIEG